jgi:hypothetical protein
VTDDATPDPLQQVKGGGRKRISLSVEAELARCNCSHKSAVFKTFSMIRARPPVSTPVQPVVLRLRPQHKKRQRAIGLTLEWPQSTRCCHSCDREADLREILCKAHKRPIP